MDEPTEMMRRVADAERYAVTTDAPEDVNPVPYDPGLERELQDFGRDALKTYGVVVVRGADKPERYNTAVRWALGGWAPPGEVVTRALSYELKDGCVFITDPTADAS